MKALLLVLISTFILLSCACPSSDVCFLVVGHQSGTLAPICIDKGYFSKSEEDRDYKIFGSFEELVDYMMDIYMENTPERSL